MNQQKNKIPSIIEMPSSVIRSAYHCKGTDATRANICGIYLEKNGGVIATNGHILYRAKCNFNIHEPILILPERNIAAAAKDTKIIILNDNLGYIEYYTGTKSIKIKRIMFEYIKNPDFPDYESAIKPRGKFLKSGLSVNANYFALIEKIFPDKCNGVYIEFNDLFFITIKPQFIRDIKKEELIIMCMKSEADKFITKKLND
ncbi:MAG: hypothetical protein KAJ10_10155 [Thermodesulfovibrionia bacterium]|nr:hypothetical protein [Thermodesulfovibrionia bacterium]